MAGNDFDFPEIDRQTLQKKLSQSSHEWSLSYLAPFDSKVKWMVPFLLKLSFFPPKTTLLQVNAIVDME